jgi:hypothetical protein
MAAHTKSGSQRPSSPPRDYSPNKWNEYTSEQGRFRIRFPGKPTEELSPADVHFLSYSGLLDYRVSYVDKAELNDDLSSAKRYLRETKSATLELTRISGERVVRERTITVDGRPGYFSHVESATGWICSEEVVAGQRVYTIIVEGRKNVLAGSYRVEKVALGFINSFKLISSRSKPNKSFGRERRGAFRIMINPAMLE